MVGVGTLIPICWVTTLVSSVGGGSMISVHVTFNTLIFIIILLVVCRILVASLVGQMCTNNIAASSTGAGEEFSLLVISISSPYCGGRLGLPMVGGNFSLPSG